MENKICLPGEPKGEIVLTIKISRQGEYKIANYSGTKVNEVYKTMFKDEAIISMTSLLCGFQPPRFLVHRDIPFPEILFEPEYQI